MLVWLAIFVTLIGGVAGAMQVRILGNVYAKIGLLGNLLVNFVIATIIIFIIVVVTSLIQYRHPWQIVSEMQLNSSIKIWESSAGIFSIIIISCLGFGTSQMGVTGTLVVFLFSQIILGVVLDYFGLFGGQVIVFTPLKILSIILMCLGVFLFFKT